MGLMLESFATFVLPSMGENDLIHLKQMRIADLMTI